MKPPRALSRLLLALAVLAVAGCASGVKPPTRAEITLQASPAVNPDADGRPSPIALSVFELKASGKFGSADFLSLYERPDKTLGSDLARRDEVLLAPGESKTISLTFQEGSGYLGVVGGFRRFGEARWRALAEVPRAATSHFVVRADALSVTIERSGR